MVCSSFNNSTLATSVRKKHLIIGMEPYDNSLLEQKQAWYRIQFDETDFTTMTLAGITRFEDTYYQAANDDINHVINGESWQLFYRTIMEIQFL